MPEKIEHRGFFTTYKGITNTLITPAGILPASMTRITSDFAPVEITALWDTGAVGTCIQPWLKDRLNLRLYNPSGMLTGVGGSIKAYIALVDIHLAYNLIIQDHPVHIVEFPGNADILIGMDILSMGNFAVCNADNITSFSFIIPPFPEHINFIDRAEAANKESR